MKNKIKKLLVALGACFTLTTILYGCSSTEGDFSPEAVIENVLADSNTFDAYYGESVMKSNDGTPDLYMKEWITTDGRVRYESSMNGSDELSITINNGTEITSYDEATNTAFRIGVLEDFQMPSPKEQAEMMLKGVRDSHTITLVGEEELLDRKVYHIKAEANDRNSLYGNQEIWVDMENWVVLKSKSSSGDMEIDYEYKKIEFNPTMDDSLFTIDLPADVKIQNLDELTKESVVQSIEEAINLFGKPFLFVEETDELMIENITYMSFGEDEYGELSIIYFKNDLPYFTLSLFEIGEENEPYNGDSGINIRGFQGEKMEMDNFKLLNWKEDGIGYSVILDHPDLSFEEVLSLLEGMELTE